MTTSCLNDTESEVIGLVDRKQFIQNKLGLINLLRMCSKIKIGVSNGLCEHLRRHASTVSFFASTSNDRMCLASSEHFAEYNWRKASTSKISPGSNSFFFSFHTVVY